jgi:hypothetical protein
MHDAASGVPATQPLLEFAVRSVGRSPLARGGARRDCLANPSVVIVLACDETRTFADSSY